MKFPVILLCVASLISSPFISAQSSESIEGATALIKSGNYDQAADILQRLEVKSPKDGHINMLLGECALAQNEIKDAIEQYKEAQKKGINNAWLSLADIAATQYRINDAEEDIELYRKGLKRTRKKTDPDESGEVVEKIEHIKNMLDRVEKIVIIDSLSVPAADFFTYYRLSPESGTLTSRETVPAGFEPANPTVVYTSESGMEQIYAINDSSTTKLASSALLFGGEREKPIALKGSLNEGGDANYPFLMPDGITLYYANNGENSLGGYDIFISRKSGMDYLQPQNIGMPYNSPYNDYLLAIDEITGTGWWATDRNHVPGMLTIYVFIPSDMRTNYSPDDPNLASFARIDSYKATWAPDTDYSELLAKIRAIKPSSEDNGPTFEFYIPGRGILTSLDSFKSQPAAEAMRQYLSQSESLEKTRTELNQLREKYAKGNVSTAGKINELESKLRHDTNKLKSIRNTVIRLETN
ncbi:MAG: tetratricopeptide repeat protein [Muribaculaceae bacterium]|nr:tetratricopeptide repeat protein [Muribaculaceae bacterium]